mmetsp:Transcript_10875/g.28752  ORF Transcript_10875/g.28752 Transcript_10875/m.28752 type:complete len:182 (-) Transcript_10875:336-881(-)
MKPDWDRLMEKFNYKTNGHVVDVDCTADDGKKLCEDYGVSGYPTLKYFKKGGDSKGTSYEGGREWNDLNKFMRKNSKKPCDPASLDNCGKKDKKYLEEIKDMDAATISAEHLKMAKEIAEKKAKKDAEEALFEKQKDEAIATQKRASELKTELSKLDDKYGYKLAILAAKMKGGEQKTEEL